MAINNPTTPDPSRDRTWRAAYTLVRQAAESVELAYDLLACHGDWVMAASLTSIASDLRVTLRGLAERGPNRARESGAH
ncbi:MAG TPA: hypothetical protein VIO16_14785 [Dehalococcoidia bacterium]